MKKHIIWLLFCLVTLTTSAQKKPITLRTGNQDTLATRKWVREYLKGLQQPATIEVAKPAEVVQVPQTPTLPVSGCEVQEVGIECIWLNGLDGIEHQGTTLTGGNKKTAIDNWYEDGGKAVQITTDWHDMEQSAGVLKNDERERLLAVLNYLQSKGMKAYIKLHMTISHLQCFGGCPSHIYDIESDGVKTPNGNYQNGGGVPMTFYSPKVANMERYWGLMTEVLKPYQTMVFVAVTTEPNQEAQYVIDAATDYHPLENQAFAAWQNATYGNILGNQPQSFDGEIGRRWMRFKSHTLVQFAKRWGKVFTNAGFQTMYDTGSYSDNIIWRGVWGVPTESLKPEITGLKDNPDFWGNYDIELIAGLITSYNATFNMMETTFNPQQNIGDNVARIVHEIERARQAGIRIVNFSFFSNYHDKSSPNYQAGHSVMQQLKARGWLAKTRVCGSFCKEIPFYSSKALVSGGFMGGYSNEYREASKGCESTGKPRIKVINDL